MSEDMGSTAQRCSAGRIRRRVRTRSPYGPRSAAALREIGRARSGRTTPATARYRSPRRRWSPRRARGSRRPDGCATGDRDLVTARVLLIPAGHEAHARILEAGTRIIAARWDGQLRHQSHRASGMMRDAALVTSSASPAAPRRSSPLPRRWGCRPFPSNRCLVP